VLPSMMNAIYRGSYSCQQCGRNHNFVAINDSTVVTEFSYNYYLPNGKCSHTEDERYCVLVPWTDFVALPDTYIERAYMKRSEPIAEKVRVYGT
jgi:hypothetical protein